MRYTKGKPKSSVVSDTALLGMLYVAEVRLVNRAGEKIKHKILLVGCERDDIDRKMRWLFDATQYKEFHLQSVEKVREKVHFLSTTIVQDSQPETPIVVRGERSEPVQQIQTQQEAYDPLLFAVGIATTMLAKDAQHALRKVGHALISHSLEGSSHSGAQLSADSTVEIEVISKSSGYAAPRDVSQEANRAHFVRG